MRIYLCSRVAADARALNDHVAKALRQNGHEVFVPHEHEASKDGADPFPRDMSEMQRAEVCVAVGRLGRDCAAEVGWFHARDRAKVQWVPGLTGTEYINNVRELACSPMMVGMVQAIDLHCLVANLTRRVIMFVGQSLNSKKTGEALDASTVTGRRLALWEKVIVGGHDQVRRLNACTLPGGVRPTHEDVEKLKGIGREVTGAADVRIVALGRVAAEALRKAGQEHFELPHPSGRNLKINDLRAVQLKLEECARWVRQ